MTKTQKSLLNRVISLVLVVLLLTSIVPIAVVSVSAAKTDILFGDVNGDGTIDFINDVVMVNNYINGSISFSEEQKVLADVNGDSSIDNTDVQLLNTVRQSGDFYSLPIYEFLIDAGISDDGIKYFLKNDGALTIFGEGKIKNHFPWKTYAEMIRSIDIKKGITEIGSMAFAFCENIEIVDFCDSISLIDNQAFWHCESISKVVIPDSVKTIGVQAFEACTSLMTISIGGGVDNIKASAFYECKNLQTIDVSYGNQTYYSIDGILFNKSDMKLIQYPTGNSRTEYTLPNGTSEICARSFAYCNALKKLNIAKDVKKINNYAFYRCNGLLDIMIPDGVNTIYGYAFCDCANLENVVISNTVTDIGVAAFLSCPKLESVTIGTGINTIKGETFKNCSKLVSIKMPESLISVESGAFENCSSLSQFDFPSSVHRVGYYALYNTAYYNDDSNWNNDVLYKDSFLIHAKESISGTCTIKAGTTLIADYAFDNCSQLKTVIIPNGIEYIGEGAFRSCSSLDNVEIGKGILSIKECAFEECTSLKEVSIPESVTDIENQAFIRCNNLESIYIPDSVKTIGGSTFYKCGKLTIYGFIGSYAQTFANNNNIPFVAIDHTATISMTDCIITLSPTPYTYDGTAKQPSVTVKYGSTTLTEGTDYTVSYPSSCITPGNYILFVTGKGDYSGEVGKSFTIYPKAISSTTITLSQSSYTYDGTEKKPTVTVKDGSKTLTNGTDYEVTYSNNTNAGTATVTVTGKGSYYTTEGNYAGSTTKNFTINPKSISSATVTLSPTSYTYDGTEKKPTVTVKDGSKTLTSGTDYTVSYSNNINVGTATVTVTGKGNYSGSKNAEFTISPGTILYPMAQCAIRLAQESFYIYSGTPCEPAIVVTHNGNQLVKDRDYYVEYSNNINAGTATVFVHGKNNLYNGVGYKGDASITFPISPRNLTDSMVTLSQTSYTYDGTAKRPSVTVKDGSTTLTSGTDYTVSYSNNINVGTATVIVTGKGNYKETATKAFSITAKSISSATVTLSQSSYTYDGTERKPTVTVKDGTKTLTLNTDYTVKYENNINVGSATVTVTGIGNYANSVSKSFEIIGSTKTLNLDTLKYNFDNSYKSFGYSSSYCIPFSSYQLIYGNTTRAKQFYSEHSSTWGGSCFGMSTTSSLFNVDSSGMYPSDFNSIASKVKDLKVTNSNGTYTVKTFIEAMHVAQYGESIQREIQWNKFELNDLVNAVNNVKTTGKPVVICIWGLAKDDKKAGHAVVGYSMEKVSPYLSYINIYDCNYPNDQRKISVYYDDDGYPTEWYYNFNKKYNWGSEYPNGKISFVSYDVFEDVWNGCDYMSAYNMLSVSSDDFSLYDINNEVIATISEGELTSNNPDIIKVESISTTVDDESYTDENTILFLPIDYYRVKNEDSYQDDFTACMTHNERGASVTTSSGEVEFIVDDSAAINEAVVDSDDGETYEITLSSSNENENEEIKVQGVSNGQRIMSSSVNGFISLNNCVGANVYINGVSISDTDENSFDISSANMSLEYSSTTYDGSQKQPKVSVSMNSKVLNENADYIALYSNNITAGKATVTVYGINDYKGSKELNFNIESCSVTNCSVTLSQLVYFYDGLPKTPTVTLKYANKALTEGVDYSVSYSNNKMVGIAKVTIIGKDNYKGSMNTYFEIIENTGGYILGDADGNGEIECVDVTLIQRYLVQIEIPYTKEELMRGDVDNSGDLELTDVTAIQYYLCKLKTLYSIGQYTI